MEEVRVMLLLGVLMMSQFEKGKAKDIGVTNANSENGESFLDGVGDSESHGDGIEDSQYWNDLFDSQYLFDWPTSFMEIGGGSADAETTRTCRGGNYRNDGGLVDTDEPDVGAKVLEYITSGKTISQEGDTNSRDIYVNTCTDGNVFVALEENEYMGGGESSQVFADMTQREDAEPVFDDICDQTYTDGSGAAAADEDSLYVGRIFKDKTSIQNAIAIYAIKRLFYFKQTKSDKERLVLVCADRHCAWRVFGHVVSPHSDTCSITSRSQYGKQASSKVIAEILKSRYVQGLPGSRAMDIPAIVLQELKVSVTYMKAWYAKEADVMKTRGSEKRSYQLLAIYMHLL